MNEIIITISIRVPDGATVNVGSSPASAPVPDTHESVIPPTKPASTPPPPPAEEENDGPSAEDVRAAFLTAVKKDKAAAFAALGVEKISELKAEDYESVIAKLNEV